VWSDFTFSTTYTRGGYHVLITQPHDMERVSGRIMGHVFYSDHIYCEVFIDFTDSTFYCGGTGSFYN